MMIRKLAFSNEPWALDILSHATVLIVPSFNGDGRAANTRGNATGQDLNRDHGLLSQPETFAFAKFVRDYTPEVMVDGHHFGDNNTCDLPLLQPRHLNTAPSIHNESKNGLVEGWFYDHSVEGWWPCPYPAAPIPGASSFTRVNGLKNMVVTLVEARSGAGPTRPGEAGGENRRRLAYSHLWSIQQALRLPPGEPPTCPARDRRRDRLPVVRRRPDRAGRRLASGALPGAAPWRQPSGDPRSRAPANCSTRRRAATW